MLLSAARASLFHFGIDDDDEPDIPPEQRLFRAIVANAVLDAVGKSRTNYVGARDKARADAVRWFRIGGEDYELVCELAGLDPRQTRKTVLDFIAAGGGETLRKPSGSIGRTPRRKAKVAA